MATKNLTHIFMIMRDKAIQRRNMYKRVEAYSDQDSLVHSEEMENGVGGPGDCHLPEWAGMVEEVQYNILTLKEKTKRLAALQSNLVRRPSLDDNTEEERQLTAHNNEIRRTLERCQMLMIQIKHSGGRGREELLNKNVIRALGFALQEVKNEFMTTCSAFTTSMNNFKKSSSFVHEGGGGDYDSDYGTFDAGGSSMSCQNQAWTQEQMLFLADNTQMVQENDRAVQQILQSTVQLNQLFKDVAQLVSEQGTILDRIDFNVEHAAIKVEEGSRQLKKADHYHRRNRNMKCILGLSGTIITLIFILVIIKT